MTYVIQNVESGFYLVRPWAKDQYSPHLDQARLYESFERAELDCCGKERVLSMEQAMRESL